MKTRNLSRETSSRSSRSSSAASNRNSGNGNGNGNGSGSGGASKTNRTKGRKQSKKPVAKQAVYPADDETEEYEVERILNDAVIHGVHMYLIKWKGYPHESNTWTAESQLSCPEILKEYLATRKESRVDLSRFYTLLKDAPGMPITVVNDVDDVSYPEGFTYINDNIYSDEVPRPCSPMFPCKCTDECRGACPCVRAQHYDDNGRVQTPVDIPLMECGPRCQCGNKCTTKVVQRGSNVLFEIFRAELKGWGVRAKGVILKGTFITEYVGEVISFEEAERRGMEDTAVGLTYLFDLDKAFEDHEIADFSIDAKTHGNISHFFNHSCDPNMEIRPVYIEHRDPRLHRLAFFATRDIAVDEELTFDYNPAASTDSVKFACHCGSKCCRKFIFS